MFWPKAGPKGSNAEVPSVISKSSQRMAFTVEHLESAKEKRSRIFLDGGQQLAGVRFGGQGREETWPKCQKSTLVHQCLLNFYVHRACPGGGKEKSSRCFPQTAIMTCFLEYYSDEKINVIPESQWQGVGKKKSHTSPSLRSGTGKVGLWETVKFMTNLKGQSRFSTSWL